MGGGGGGGRKRTISMPISTEGSGMPTTKARCGSVVRAFAHGAMGRQIYTSLWIH